jgi:hypothetical protein
MGHGLSREVACEQAYTLVKEAMRSEWPQHEKVVHTLEMAYYDDEGCAITVSVPTPTTAATLTKAEIAAKYAFVGLTKEQFQKLSKLPVSVTFDYDSACWDTFNDAGFSYYDGVYVCWNYGEIVGHCSRAGCTRKFQ